MGLQMENPIKNLCISTDTSFLHDQLRHRTVTRELIIDKFVSVIAIIEVDSDQSLFANLCESGCRNYGTKYSCPPYSPKFSEFSGSASRAQVICYKVSLDQFAPIPLYSRIRAGNSVLKSLIDKELSSHKAQGHKVAGSGSCRRCKVCGAKLKEPCKKPDRRIYSLEALGVNVDRLVHVLFGFQLQWYLPGRKLPDYTCTVGAVLDDAPTI